VSNPAISRVLQASLVVMNLIIGALILEIGKGTVPIPDDLTWIVPIVLAALNGISLFLPRVGSERLAQQVDALKSRGVSRGDMMVVSRGDAAGAAAFDQDALAEAVVEKIRAQMEQPRVRTIAHQTVRGA
jgi:hypothetical protein